MRKPEFAIFIDGPYAGRVMQRPGGPDFFSEIVAADLSTPVVGLDPSRLDVRPPQVEKVYYRALRGVLPFGYVPYLIGSGGFTSQHAETATRMIELLVQQGHAESVAGLRTTVDLLGRRLTALDARLSAVIANHNLSALMDEPAEDA